MQNFHDFSELVDPRPFDGTRFTYPGNATSPWFPTTANGWFPAKYC